MVRERKQQRYTSPPGGEDGELEGSQTEGGEAGGEGITRAKERDDRGLGPCQGQGCGRREDGAELQFGEQ